MIQKFGIYQNNYLLSFNEKAMIPQLEKVIGNLNKLTSTEQDAIAELIEDELLWDVSLEKSLRVLSKLADEALKEHHAGKTKDDY